MASPAASARSEASARKSSSSLTFLLFQAFEIGDDIGAVLYLREPREGHLGALRKVLRLVEPDIELVRTPFLALVRSERLRELIVRHRGDVLLHDAVEVGADLVGTAFVKGVALLADLGNLLAMLRVGLGHNGAGWPRGGPLRRPAPPRWLPPRLPRRRGADRPPSPDAAGGQMSW